MAEGVLFNIIGEILKNLGSRAIDEIASVWGFKARLEKLKSTITTINDVLLDAEERQADSRVVRGWLEKLATVVYAADDLFDEVTTVASRKQIMGANKFTNKVHTFFSSSNQVAFALNVSQKIKKIRHELDDIVKDSTEFAFAYRPHEDRNVINTIRGRDQTHSYVDADEVIGRDGDKKAILDILLETDNEVLNVIPIVGIGGQGKTTLAQLIHNDPQVVEYFELRLWVCVSEEIFDIKIITEKILKSATNTEIQNLEMDQLQGHMRKEIGDKRYLLVLDDVWNEEREEWLKLRALLKIGRQGSKILVTTRSREVGKIMGTVPIYELQGLLEDKSWDLFQKMAFEPGEAQQMPRLMEVGKEIVKKCVNVPLAIRTVGSLLYGKDESRWISFKDRSLANISDSRDGIISILKLSYQHLNSSLKSCFAYCALFPKDYEFDKETLISLWMAEGFIIPSNHEGKSLEELAEECFFILLQRCFFQDVKRDEWGGILSCKMHDLMHDLAQQVAGINCKVAKFGDSNSNKGIRHLSFAYRLTSSWKTPSWMLNLKPLRTFLLPEQRLDGSPFSKSICQELISNFRCLRVLDLNNLGVQSLPSSIGNLIHLRYLNLSQIPIRELPESITELHNLQTLNLYNCLSLRILPMNMKKLINLRSLDIGECLDLYDIPSGLGELTCLTKLPRFVVDHSCFGLPNLAKLSDLKSLNRLRGVLDITIFGALKNPLLEAMEANLNDKHGLTCLRINYASNPHNAKSSNHDEAVLEGLKPHPNLRNLYIRRYSGEKLPSWAVMDNLYINLPNLVEVFLSDCNWCQQIPSFGQLRFLKCLRVFGLHCLEYMETNSRVYDHSSESPKTEAPFFPSLESLILRQMDNLKGWWKTEEIVNNNIKEASHQSTTQHLLSMSFSNLSELQIYECPKLEFLPQCPNVEMLSVVDVNETVSVSKMITSTMVSSSKLQVLRLSNVEELITFPTECLHQLTALNILDKKVASTDRLGEVFTSKSSSSLNCLQFMHCDSLISIARGLEQLTAMKRLDISDCKQLDISADEELPWKYFKSLGYLDIEYLPKLLVLPSGLRHLASLVSLKIKGNDELKELPEWISCFTSLGYIKLSRCPKLTSLPEAFRKLTTLYQLKIKNCPGLTKRCRGPNGSEWNKIQHIPLVTVIETTECL